MASIPQAGLALTGGDPRRSINISGQEDAAITNAQLHCDPSVTFDEYLYHARASREMEKGTPTGGIMPLRKILGFGKTDDVIVATSPKSDIGEGQLSEKMKSETGKSSLDIHANPSLGLSDQAAVPSEATGVDWTEASRAGRSATWGAIFYLITTDILGPMSAPWAISQMGYGPGTALYVVFGILAAYAGWQLWTIFLKLDSYKYPRKNYGDLVYRLYGKIPRHVCNVLQTLQLSVNIGLVVLLNAQGIVQMAPSFCFVAACVIFTAAGGLVGQVRTFQKFQWLANVAVVLNITTIIMVLAVVSHSDPNYVDAIAEGQAVDIGPILTYASFPPSSLETRVTGLMQAVYAYGGAMLFCEFMTEMKRPMDFWKAMICAQVFIFCLYVFFDLYVYSCQGQYTLNPAYQSMSPYNFQVASNSIGIVTSLISGGLFGNVGLKVVYQTIFRELCGAPELSTKKGKIIWSLAAPVYWILAFIIAAALPNFSSISSLIAAVCTMQFSYTFPPLMMLGLTVRLDSMLPGEGYDPSTGQTIRHDSGFKRMLRGLKKNWYIKLFDLIFFLGSAVTAVLGLYASVQTLIAAFASGTSVSFSCKSPFG